MSLGVYQGFTRGRKVSLEGGLTGGTSSVFLKEFNVLNSYLVKGVGKGGLEDRDKFWEVTIRCRE